MSGPAIFVTGASGFVGRRLLPALARRGQPVVALDRSGTLAAAPLPAGVSVCRGDLLDPATYVEALRSCDLVVHLAAATGKASAAEHQRVNALGTVTLLEACRQAGVGRVLFVSSIAVTFGDQTGYHYAVAKTAAEQAVTGSGLRTAIVRPTMIFGAGSPVEAGLAKLALLPRVVVPGRGRVRVQPIHVDDVVACLVEIIDHDRFAGEVLEIGGPDVLAIENLLQAIRTARGAAAAGVAHLPLPLLRAPVLVAERLGLGAVLPVTAGQLASFDNEGVARPNTLHATEPARMVPLARMLGNAGPSTGSAPPPAGIAPGAPARPPVPEAPEVLDHECQVFTYYLLGVPADRFVQASYRDAVARVPALQARTAFDEVLLAWARHGGWRARAADGYAALFARDSALRRRLVMTLAILESRAPFHHLIDAPAGLPGAAQWLRIGGRVAIGVASTALGMLVFGGLRLARTVTGRAR